MNKQKNGYIYYDYRKKSEKEEIGAVAWRSVFRWLYVIVGVLFVCFFSSMLCFHVVSVDGNSMTPTLQDGDKLFVYTLNYQPKQGDIVVLGDGRDESVLVKRVIALENQIVDIDYDAGVVTVDGKPVDDSYAFETTVRANNEIAYPYKVKAGHIFVLGDNRNVSLDSRNRGIASVDECFIVGKAICRLYPFAKWDIYTEG